MSESADVIVVGLGPGGEQAAGDCLAGGLSVIGIEAELVGGECPYWGCIPSKMAIRAATVLEESRRINGLAGESTEKPDWNVVAQRIRNEATDNWDDTVAVDRFTANGGTFVRGRATIVGPREVEVDGVHYTATKALIIAAGTRAAIPPIPGLDNVPYWTNREALKNTEMPASLIVLGGGAIGCELAQAYSRFGADVTIVEAAPRVAFAEEPEAGELLKGALEADGLTVITGTGAKEVAAQGNGVSVTLADGTELVAEALLVATGRRCDLAALNTEAIGIDPKSNRAIPTDDFLAVLDDNGTKLDGVYAIGDVAGKGAFTHVAVSQGRMAADQVLGKSTAPWSSRRVGRATFTDPEIGSVGLTEQAARDSGLDIVTATSPMEDTTRGWIHGEGNKGLFKLVVDKDTGAIVGGTVVGPHAGELLSGLTVAVAGGVPVQKLIETVWAYPTYHRGFDAVLAALPASVRNGR